MLREPPWAGGFRPGSFVPCEFVTEQVVPSFAANVRGC
jgi:hypothetical protein